MQRLSVKSLALIYNFGNYFMSALLITLHVFVCIALIMIVLLQTGKGADMGAAFGGGSSQTLFGSTGASTFLSKATTVAAIIFMVTSLALAYLSSHKTGNSIMTDVEIPAPVEQPAPVEESTTETAVPAGTQEPAPVAEIEMSIPVEKAVGTQGAEQPAPVEENTADEAPVVTETPAPAETGEPETAP
jgi:preprotein translocase subunit SecG